MDWWTRLTDLQKIFASIAVPATAVMVLQLVLMLLGLGHGGESTDSADVSDDLDLHDGISHEIPDGHDHDIFSGHSDEVIDGHDLDAYDGDSDDVFDSHIHEGLDPDDMSDDHTVAHIHDISDGHDDAADDSASHTDEGGNDRSDALRLFTIRGIVGFLAVGGWMGVAAIDWKLSEFLAVVLSIAAGWLAMYFVAWLIRAFVRMQQSGNIKLVNAVGKEGDVYLTIPAEGRGKVNVIIQDKLCEVDAVTKAGRAIKTGEKIIVTGVFSEDTLLVAPKTTPKEMLTD